jgi:Fur family ferric uptake transcriptional regulator
MIRRSTPTKEAVISVLNASNRAMSQDAIEQRIKIEIDRATIYRVLNQFCEDGLVHKIVADDGKQYFAVCKKCDQQTLPDNHFHFRCIKCQTIECLPIMVNFSLPQHYEVEKVNCVLVGTCANCISQFA